MSQHEKINYVEFPSSDIESTKHFFSQAFGWEFVDYGPDYCSITNGGIDGGFFRSELTSKTARGSALIVIYSKDLEATESKVIQAGGTITKPTFPFPGGRRFHFEEPSGSEFAVWSDAGG